MTGVGCQRKSHGLSPRVRGNLARCPMHSGHPRSIPACAGEPGSSSRGIRWRAVYPRVCGGTSGVVPQASGPRGLSPRVRGNLAGGPGSPPASGSIPACAGEPVRCASSLPKPAVYPRVCGGTTAAPASSVRPQGLSPRVRGNHGCAGFERTAAGSIPACAGEPVPMRSAIRRARVYPRVCGGTAPAQARTVAFGGLSPRVRGNRRTKAAAVGYNRSIPACAGEPLAHFAELTDGAVYPRVCGGTQTQVIPLRPHLGLSPRVRGNLLRRQKQIWLRWSIPACAGEPRPRAARTPKFRVYPRVCGGTAAQAAVMLDERGLSPRVRGNRDDGDPLGALHRSIPACAGEPRVGAEPGVRLPVYPRVCGGTRGVTSATWTNPGLSPRVRGNRSASPCRMPASWSIPACAGEPRRGCQRIGNTTVYPRVCGGTAVASTEIRRQDGLSPRVRGNPRQARLTAGVVGSIPACAGEPCEAAPP